MQIASWLLVLRAVREGDMRLHEAADPKYRLAPPETQMFDPLEDGLPQRLITLIDDAEKLYARIARLDGNLFEDAVAETPSGGAAAQLRTLEAVFGGAR